MKKNKTGNEKNALVLIDTLIVIFALFSSWLIRSQFEYFIYGASKFIFLFPWVLFSRLFSHYFFGIYTFSIGNFNNKDISRIFIYNAIPTIILFVFRIIQPVFSLLIMPLSMIAMEYFFSSVGFIVIRLYLNARFMKKDLPSGYKRRILIWADIREIEESLDILQLFETQNIEISGIINSNPLFWDTDYQGYRVFGDESEIPVLLSEDDRISTVAFLNGQDLTKKQKNAIIQLTAELHMEIGHIDNNCFEIKDSKWLLDL